MRSRAERQLVAALAAGLLCTAAAQPPPPASGERPTEAEIRSAVARLRADPDFAHTRKTRVLAWRRQSESRDRPGTSWVSGLLGWVGETARVLLWVAGTLAAGFLIIYLGHLVRFARQRSARSRPVTLPTHIRDLDIRPESLPDDIGAAALALWDRGEQRAALALLYRGMLSRLVHVYEVPIRHSSTEGDCERLAAAHLLASQMAYVSRLIRMWQAAVYGGNPPAPQAFRELCAELAVLERTAASSTPQAA